MKIITPTCCQNTMRLTFGQYGSFWRCFSCGRIISFPTKAQLDFIKDTEKWGFKEFEGYSKEQAQKYLHEFQMMRKKEE